MFVLLIHTQTNMMGYTHTKSCLSMSGAKMENTLRLYFSDDATSRCLCSLWMVLWGRRQRYKLINWLMTCQPNGTDNNRQNLGMSGSVSPWTWCVPSSYWYRGRGVEIPGKKDVWPCTDQSHQYWRCRGFIDMARERIKCIWRVWELGGDGYGAVGLGEIS